MKLIQEELIWNLVKKCLLQSTGFSRFSKTPKKFLDLFEKKSFFSTILKILLLLQP
jgi:hypothetical protein